MTEKKSDSARFSPEQYFSRVSYVKINEIQDDVVVVENQFGFTWKIAKQIMETEMVSACQVDEEKNVTRTEIVNKLLHAGDTIFTIHFSKKNTENAVADRLESVTMDDLQPPRKRRALAKELLEGSERTLIGYLWNAEPEMGRSRVIDLEIDGSLEQKKRLVDHRTIHWLILNRVKYVVK